MSDRSRRRARRGGAAICAAALLTMWIAALPGPAQAGTFSVRCSLSHRATEDPIVHPGMTGMSHWHDFYGARGTSGSSTYTLMTRARTTCGDRFDTAGYWHPRISFDGRARTARLTAYYSRGGKSTVRPFPRNLMMIAGDAHATAAQPLRVVYFRCAGSRSGPRRSRPPRCAPGQQLTVNVAFPDCWDGRRLDSSNHHAHVRYSWRGRCRASHPVGIPRLVMTLRFRQRPQRARSMLLASGSYRTMHADFWNTWNQRRLRRLVHQCLETELSCGTINNRR